MLKIYYSLTIGHIKPTMAHLKKARLVKIDKERSVDRTKTISVSSHIFSSSSIGFVLIILKRILQDTGEGTITEYWINQYLYLYVQGCSLRDNDFRPTNSSLSPLLFSQCADQAAYCAGWWQTCFLDNYDLLIVRREAEHLSKLKGLLEKVSSFCVVVLPVRFHHSFISWKFVTCLMFAWSRMV